MALKFKLNIRATPSWARYAIIIVPSLVIGLVFFFASYKPMKEEIVKLKDDIARLEQQIVTAETKLRRLPELQRLYAKLVAELNVLKSQLPEEKEVSNLLKQVSDLGIKAGLTIGLWRPQNRKTHSSGIVYEIPVQVAMTGSYHKLGAFFSSLTELMRIVNITDISLGGAKPLVKEAELGISFNAVTFSAVPEEEQSASAGRKSR
jgi:type IV pilus assembly protein PilO